MHVRARKRPWQVSPVATVLADSSFAVLLPSTTIGLYVSSAGLKAEGPRVVLRSFHSTAKVQNDGTFTFTLRTPSGRSHPLSSFATATWPHCPSTPRLGLSLTATRHLQRRFALLRGSPLPDVRTDTRRFSHTPRRRHTLVPPSLPADPGSLPCVQHIISQKSRLCTSPYPSRPPVFSLRCVASCATTPQVTTPSRAPPSRLEVFVMRISTIARV